ncbi:MAG: ABC transporter substrate-binding protein [Acidovorax sp.]
MDLDRREVLQSLAALAGMAAFGTAQAQAVDLAAQPFVKIDPKEKPVRGGTLRLAAPVYIGNLNPNRWPVNDWLNMNFIFQKLVVTDEAYRPTIPFLAKSVVRDGQNQALMTLREGITFHDGTPLDAEAVKSYIEWIRTPANATFTGGWLANLDTVEVAAPLQLRWKFKDAWAAYEGVMANVPGFALSPTALKKDSRRFEVSAPSGTGSYMVEEASPGNFLKLKRNPNYWLGKVIGQPDMPYFDNILISVIPDPAVRLASFRAGKLDMLTLDKSQYPTLKADKAVDVYVTPISTCVAYRMNALKGPCADIRVRKAIRHAIDVKALIQGTQHGIGRLASGLFPSDHWAHDPDLKPAEFNPKLSKSLLAEAGLTKGVDIRGYVYNSPDAIEVAESIKNMLAQVGIRWQVDALSPVAADARRKSMDWDLRVAGWNFIQDPDLPMTGLYHPKGAFAEGAPAQKTRDSLIEAARMEPSLDKRKAMYRLLEKQTNDDCVDLWLWWEEIAVAYQKWVRGFDHKASLKYKEAYFVTHANWFANGKRGN